VVLRELFTALAIDVVMLLGMVLPLFFPGSRFQALPLRAPIRSWIKVLAIGWVSGATMVLLSIWYLGTHGSSGYQGFWAAGFWWGMAGFGLMGGFLSLLMGVFATDSARTNKESWTSFLMVSTATLAITLALGVPFAYLLTWPRFWVMRLLIGPGALIVLIAAASPVVGVAGWFAERFGPSRKANRL
jgi:hypothetical protein